MKTKTKRAAQKKQVKKSASKTISAIKKVERKCDVCGYKTFENHCKLVCPNCGAQSDCSDP